MKTGLPVEWAVASRPIDAEIESGDLHVVQPFESGLLLGAIDGLGHGAKAAEAARLCADALREDPSAAVDVLFERCNERLRHSRGAVMTLASLHEKTGEMIWSGIGNVEALLLKPDGRDSLALRNGVIGDGMARAHLSTRMLARGDLLLFATDGIRPGFSGAVHWDVRWSEPAQGIADAVLAAFKRDNDDALVLVARWLP
jgi:hypothetical protein